MSKSTKPTPRPTGLAAYQQVFECMAQGDLGKAKQLLKRDILDSTRKIYREISEGDAVVSDRTAVTESKQPVLPGKSRAPAKKSTMQRIKEAAMKYPKYRQMNPKDRMNFCYKLAEKYNLLETIENERKAAVSAAEPKPSEILVANTNRIKGFDKFTAEQKTEIRRRIAEELGIMESLKQELDARGKPAAKKPAPSKIIEANTAEIEGFDGFTKQQKTKIRLRIAEKLGILEELKDEIQSSSQKIRELDQEVENEEIMDDADPEVAADDEEVMDDGLDSGDVADELEDVLPDESEAEAVFPEDDCEEIKDRLDNIEDSQDEIMQAIDDMHVEFEKVLGAAVEDAAEEAEDEVADNVVDFENMGGGDEEVADGEESDEDEEEDDAKNESVMTDQEIREFLSKVAKPAKVTADNNKSPTPSPAFTSTGQFDRKKPQIGGGNEKGRKAPKVKDGNGTTRPNVKKVGKPTNADKSDKKAQKQLVGGKKIKM